MPARRAAPAPAPAPVAVTLDLAAIALVGGRLVVLVQRGPGGEWTLPRAAMMPEALDRQAAALARETLGKPASWLSLSGVFHGEAPQKSGFTLNIGFVALTVAEPAAELEEGYAWQAADDLPLLEAPGGDIVRAGLSVLRDRIDRAPVAFRLLPPLFTLTDLQRAYEVVHGRRLHKASFRRALQGAGLVEAVEEWRSEGRGRPARLYRYVPRKRRGGAPSVRFDY